MKNFIILAVALLSTALPVWAQQEFNNWCFGEGGLAKKTGNGILIHFTPKPQPADTCKWNNGNSITGFGGFGNATISDAERNLLFYFDGGTVINRQHQRMANGLLLDASVFTSQVSLFVQPTVIVPAGHEQYYVFYWVPVRQGNDPAYDLTYAVVDMRLQGGDGAVVSKGTVLTRTTCPRVTAVRHANNYDFWVITRDLEARGFQAFRLGAVGTAIGSPMVSLAGQTLPASLAELKAAPNGRRLVCSALTRTASNERTGSVCVYDFDPATGQVGQELVVRSVVTALTNLAGGPLLSASFSPDANLLYTSELGAVAQQRRGNDIWQYDLRLGTAAAIAQSRRLVSDVPLPPNAYDGISCLGLQLAPDGTLWSSQCIQRRLINPNTNQVTGLSAAIIRQPNVYGPGCGFEAEAYPYRVGQSPSLTLPNLITNMLYAPATLNFEADCGGDSVRFWASSAGLPASLHWDFGEPASGAANAAIGTEVAHRYARAGTYRVRLTLADGRVLAQDVDATASLTDFTGQNIFTPNNDGRNDWFEPVRGALPGARLQVFSRWGQRVFAAEAPPEAAPHWNGTGAAAGEYFWELRYPDCQGRPQHRKGTLTLVR